MNYLEFWEIYIILFALVLLPAYPILISMLIQEVKKRYRPEIHNQ